MNIDSIIFDLDGTLWDSTDVVLKAWNVVLQDNDKVKGQISREDMKGIMGLQAHQIGTKLFPYLEEADSAKLVKYCCEEEKKFLLKEGGNLYPDLELVLKTLSKDFSLFIVSNCECGYIETFLEHHKLDKYFKDIECAGNTGMVKGENIRKIIKRNHLDSPVYVGDTQGDCDGARLAEIPFVYASYGFGSVKTYDYMIKELFDIVELFKCNEKVV
jgi:phosphoglycolate phosphatase